MKDEYNANPEGWKKNYAEVLGRQAYIAIFQQYFTEAEQLAREGITIDSTKHRIVRSFAAALLFQGKYAEAESIYRQYKAELKESFLEDFNQFAEAGVIPPECEADVEKIKRILND